MTDTTGSLTVPTYSDSIAVVSTQEQHHDTIQSALRTGKNRVHVHELTSRQTWPVRTSRKIVHISADHGVKVEGHSGTAFELTSEHKRPPGPVIEGFDVRGGGTAYKLKGVKYAEFRDCHADGCDIGWDLSRTENNSCNSVTLTRCTAQQTDSFGVKAGPFSHSLVLDTMRITNSQGYGIFSNGPAKLEVRGGQVQYCSEAGIKLRRCESPTIRDMYIEENGTDASDTAVGVYLEDCVGGSVRDCYFNGLGTSKDAVLAYESPNTGVEDNTYRGYTGRNIVYSSPDSS